MPTFGYTCYGALRGACGITHRTFEAAESCCERDSRRAAPCASDRMVWPSVGGTRVHWLTPVDWVLVAEGPVSGRWRDDATPLGHGYLSPESANADRVRLATRAAAQGRREGALRLVARYAPYKYRCWEDSNV